MVRVALILIALASYYPAALAFGSTLTLSWLVVILLALLVPVAWLHLRLLWIWTEFEVRDGVIHGRTFVTSAEHRVTPEPLDLSKNTTSETHLRIGTLEIDWQRWDSIDRAALQAWLEDQASPASSAR